jgi:KDO2-lipid IV(A) lauroyltransferase
VCVIVEDDWLAWAIADARRQTGVELISVTEPPYRAIEALRQGGVLVLLADVVQPQMRACEVELLGAPADLPAGPAAIARIAGAPLVPFAALPIDTRAWRIWTGTPIAPPARGSGRDGEQAVMQRLADAFSEVIRAHPTQWAAVYELGWRT